MLVDFFRKFNTTRKVVNFVLDRRATRYIDRISGYLNPGEKILDIGSGPCNNARELKERGFDVTLLDVVDMSFVSGQQAILYDGQRMPFEDNSFDVALMLTMLHHTPDPEAIILEARRVARRLVIIEDVYENRFHKYFTCFFDSLVNWEWSGHPHTNKSDQEWKHVFGEMQFTTLDVKKQYSDLFFKHATYHLEKEEAVPALV